MMLGFGELCLLGAFIASGFAAFATLAGCNDRHHALQKSALVSSVASLLLLTLVVLILSIALLTKNYQFDYVAHYCSQYLPWYYGLSALWVGQAGSLLLWAWFLGILTMIFRFASSKKPDALRQRAFGLLMANTCFLITTMVFAADPMARSVGTPAEGAGLSPLLQHPAMLIHPPIIFLGYAAWAVPFALATSALIDKCSNTNWINANWTQQARPWALFAWAVLGAGILLGAEWAYEELGWGGYWGWDPVENGSLIPWLLGTALIHTMMTWRRCGIMKKTTVALAIATFAMCNFATFLTRSGIFSSLHAFSQSPIGWLFLALMLVLAIVGGFLIVLRRTELAPENQITSAMSREAMVAMTTIALLLLATVTCLGTLSVALSDALVGTKITVGPPFYNNVLAPAGLLILAATALAPLLRWGSAPSASEKRMLKISVAIGVLAMMGTVAGGTTHFLSVAVTGVVAFAVVVLCCSLWLDAKRRPSTNYWASLVRCLREKRNQYTGFFVHLGFFALAIGIVGSSLGTQKCEVSLKQGQIIQWAGRSIQLVDIVERQLPDKLVAGAVLEVSRNGDAPVKLAPEQHLHLLQNEWTTEVAIQSDWGGDLYLILHGGTEDGRVSLTLVDNPKMRWLWLGGITMLLGATISLWPNKKLASQNNSQSLKPSGRLHDQTPVGTAA